MKLKTNNASKKSVNINKNKSPNKQTKGVEVRKEKSKTVVKPTVLKKEAEKTKVEVPPNPAKVLQQELWQKAIENVSVKSDLADEESSIVKLLADYKRKSSIPQKSIKLKNFITKGFSKYKNTSEDVLDGIYTKILNEFKTLGGDAEIINASKVSSKKTDAKANKTKSKKEASNDEEVGSEDGDDDGDDDDDEVELDDEVEGITFGDSDNDMDDDDEEESEEEKPKPNKTKGNKANNKNGKSQPNKGKNGSKFKGGKIQKNKKFGKKK